MEIVDLDACLAFINHVFVSGLDQRKDVIQKKILLLKSIRVIAVVVLLLTVIKLD